MNETAAEMLGITHHHGYDSNLNEWTCQECGTLTDYCAQVHGN